ncbi:MAG TPA: SDR family oxidoreductase [Pseudonocardiaceae bacterium]
MTFHGRVALITGGGSGLGRRAAERLAAGGASVAVADRDAGALADLAGVTTYPCDVTDQAQVAELVDRVTADLGPIDRLVHTAAIMPAGRVVDQPTDRILDVMRVNYFGTVTVTRAVLPGMLDRRRGDVIVFGSITGYAYSTRMAAYCASKAAVNAYVEILTHEYAGSGLRFLLVAPSSVRTPLLDQAMAQGPKAFTRSVRGGRIADPDAILERAEAALERGITVLTPGEARMFYLIRRLSPNLAWWIMDLVNRD